MLSLRSLECLSLWLHCCSGHWEQSLNLLRWRLRSVINDYLTYSCSHMRGLWWALVKLIRDRSSLDTATVYCKAFIRLSWAFGEVNIYPLNFGFRLYPFDGSFASYSLTRAISCRDISRLSVSSGNSMSISFRIVKSRLCSLVKSCSMSLLLALPK